MYETKRSARIVVIQDIVPPLKNEAKEQVPLAILRNTCMHIVNIHVCRISSAEFPEAF